MRKRRVQQHLPPLGQPQRQQQKSPGPPQPCPDAAPTTPSCFTEMLWTPGFWAASAPLGAAAVPDLVAVLFQCSLKASISALSSTPLPSLSNNAKISCGDCEGGHYMSQVTCHRIHVKTFTSQVTNQAWLTLTLPGIAALMSSPKMASSSDKSTLPSPEASALSILASMPERVLDLNPQP